ncbi:GAF domain-containing protein [Halorhodospira halochloris]|uniref:HD family phosphohydrolase n=1 Tax=Halorhodospira halochloris TaxID=1052 RepID=UPI001EE80EE8|nr:HD family phosphohydrolase [Halorhodospira halochloris]MCG5530199.1 GAF domain-containing protein [Halorhodospira halochloris]
MSRGSGQPLEERLEQLLSIGQALSAETNTDALVEMILRGARNLTNADAGTVYSVEEESFLSFETVHNDSLGLHLGGTSGKPVNFPDLPLYTEDGLPNDRNVAAYSAVSGEAVRIADAYDAEGFDFSGTRRIDAQTGYRSKSFLTVPMRDHEGSVIGVLQLINALDPHSGEPTEFSAANEKIASSLASQAAIALTKQQLIDAQRELFNSFTKVIAKSIDRKNPTTGKHCERVPLLTMMVADAINESQSSTTEDFKLSPEQYDELSLAAWLHDCGKVTTPEAIVNKATKLERQIDGINEIMTRAAATRQEAQLKSLTEQHQAITSGDTEAAERAKEELKVFEQQLQDDIDFLCSANTGKEFMEEAAQERVDRIAERYTWTDHLGKEHPLLTEDEIENLKIRRGTLNQQEMAIMHDHVRVSREMLEQLNFPKHLQRTPQIAGQHHERMAGGGYPDNLAGEQICFGARILAIADVFEALTAPDRPYKETKTLSQALKIMGFMAEEGHFDKNLFQIFIEEKVYLKYAHEYMLPELIDEVDESSLPGLTKD